MLLDVEQVSATLPGMSAAEIVALAASISLLAGWRLYLVVFATGLAMKYGWVALPDQLRALDVLANNWIIGIAGAGAIAEFFADKVAWVDSAWDAIHSFIRPLGGAMLSLAIVDAGDPAWQVASFLLGGGAAFVAHAGKAGARTLVNTSPEPFSNVVVSTAEDVADRGVQAHRLRLRGEAVGVPRGHAERVVEHRLQGGVRHLRHLVGDRSEVAAGRRPRCGSG